MINYVFDVDGTLTPSRGKMDEEFRRFFLQWQRGKTVYLLTGSDAEKTIEQVGEYLWRGLVSYQCGGNVIYAYGQKVYEYVWDKRTIDGIRSTLWWLLSDSKYPHRFGNHIELRKGLVNFSTVGRDCTQEQRLQYFEWDNEHREREELCQKVMAEIPSVDATIGGQISIDIYPRGKDKGQITNFLDGPIYFFGDKTEQGGNDYALASKLADPDKVFQVDGPEHTLELLRDMT